MINKELRHLIGYAVLFFLIISSSVAMTEKESTNQNSQSISVKKPENHIVFLITKDSLNYKAHQTIPAFANLLENQHGYKVTVLLGKGTHGAYTYPGFEVLDKADLLIIFARRIALPYQQMNRLKNYLHSGKPLIGIRTANHAFTVREEISDGFEDWPDFVPSILGCKNRGYGPVEPGTDVSINKKAADHPIVKGLPARWHSQGNVYKVAPLLDSNITVLLTGKVGEIVEPVAWVRSAGSSKVFYTSLGHPTDFKRENFIKLLIGGIKWALEK